MSDNAVCEDSHIATSSISMALVGSGFDEISDI
jgi:hypothetical protein